eukprot:jgi/Hompol1/5212/HPOL_004236-RA
MQADPASSSSTASASAGYDQISNSTDHDGQHHQAGNHLPGTDDNELELLGLDSSFLVGIKDETHVQQAVIDEADRQLRVHIAEQEQTRLSKVIKAKRELKYKIEAMQLRLDAPRAKISDKLALEKRIADALVQIDALSRDEQSIRSRIAQDGSGKQSETERERLIRTGKITPFAQMSGLERSVTTLQPFQLDELRKAPKLVPANRPHLAGQKAADDRRATQNDEPATQLQSDTIDIESDESDHVNVFSSSSHRKPKRQIISDDEDGEYRDGDLERRADLSSGSVQSSGDSDHDDDDNLDRYTNVRSAHLRRNDDRYNDDGDEASYQRRLRRWVRDRRIQRNRYLIGDTYNPDDDAELESNIESEQTEPSVVYEDQQFEGGYRIPGDIYQHLFAYQKTCIKWLWELHCQEVGGLIGDEMGLGKTIQIIAYLAGLSFSGRLDGPVIIVCPATVLKQWVQEFHKWWPPFRVAILHSSGSGISTDAQNSTDSETEPYWNQQLSADDEDAQTDGSVSDDYDASRSKNRRSRKSKSKKHKKPRFQVSDKSRAQVRSLLSKIIKHGHVIVTTYAAVRIHADSLLPIRWSYCVLDEGHKIRNPDSDITMACKRFKVCWRK